MPLSKFMSSGEKTGLRSSNHVDNVFSFLYDYDYVEPVPEGTVIDEQPIEFPHRRSVDLSSTENESFAVDAIAGSLLLDERCRYLSGPVGWSSHHVTGRGYQLSDGLSKDMDTVSLSSSIDDEAVGPAIHSCSASITIESPPPSRSGFRFLRPRGSFFSLNSGSNDRTKKTGKKRSKPSLRVDTTGKMQHDSIIDNVGEAMGAFGWFKSSPLNSLYDYRPRTSSLPHVERGRKTTDLLSPYSTHQQQQQQQQHWLRRSSEQHSPVHLEKPRGPKPAISVPNLQLYLQRCASSLSILRLNSPTPHSPCSEANHSVATPDQGYHSPGPFSMSDLEEDTNKASYQAKRKTAHDIILINDTDEDYEDGHLDSVPTQSGYSLDGDSLVQEIIAANKEYGAPDEWQEVFIRLLALFNEQHVSACLEDVAIVIKRCIGRKLPENIKSSLDTFLDAGMYALYPRVVGLSGYALLAEMAKLWRRFHSQIITYLCAAFRGLRHIPMRDLLLSKFRDQIFIPLAAEIEVAFALIQSEDSNRRKQDAASLIQMCGLLLNASRHSPHGPDMVAIWRRLIAQWRSVNTRELPQPATAYV